MLSFWALDCSQHRQETQRRKPCGYHGNLSPVHRDLMLLQTEDEVSTRRQMMPQRNLWPEAPTHHQTVYLSLLCTAGLRQQVRHCSLIMQFKKKKKKINCSYWSLGSNHFIEGGGGDGGGERSFDLIISLKSNHSEIKFSSAFAPQPPELQWSPVPGRERGDQQGD